jgi:hypothetical protein
MCKCDELDEFQCAEGIGGMIVGCFNFPAANVVKM